MARKKILYFDTDTIVTGNIEDAWDYWDAISEDENVLAALAPNTFPGDEFDDIFQMHFADIKHVPPRGVNCGVMFLHLENMRAFKWTENKRFVYPVATKTPQ